MNKKILALLLLSFFLFTWRIGSIPILDGDTAAAAKIAKNMVQTGDWLTPHYQIGSPEVVSKPPLFYWIIAAGFKLFGINEFGLSLFHSLIASFTILLTYLIARELFEEKTAFLSALILLTSAQFFYQSRSPLYDVPLTFFLSAALYCFILFEKNKNYWFYYLVPVFTALAILIKGPIGLVLIGLILLIYTIWNKSFMRYINFHLILCLCLFLCLSLPWFIAEYRIMGRPFLDIFWSSNFVRFFHPVDSLANDPSINTAHPQYDFYSYLLQLFIVFAPWSGFLYPAIIANLKTKESRFILSWVFGVILFFSLSLHYKISRYILPVFPALSIITAKFIYDIKESKASNHIYSFLIVPLFIAAAIYSFLFFPAKEIAYKPIIVPFLTVFSIGILTGTILLFRKKLILSVYSFSLFALISYLVLVPCLDIYFKEANPIKEFCGIINQTAKAGDEVIIYRSMASTHFSGFYLDKNYHEFYKKEEFVPLAPTMKMSGLAKSKLFVISEDLNIQADFKNSKTISKKGGFVLFSSI